jgi:hemerythrin
MKEIEYPRFEDHTRLHKDFLGNSGLMAEFKESGPTEKMANRILTVVMDWLKDHIIEGGGDYAKYAIGRS